MTLTVGALFSGIGGLELPFHEHPDFEIVFQVEKDQACRDILARHWPDVTQYDDVTEVTYDRLRADLGDRADVDVLIGGWPCQDISLAGRRRGLAGQRSGLFYEFARIALEVAPLWIVAENVPGLLSSHSPVEDPPGDAGIGTEWRVEETSDLGVVCATLGDLGYGYAFRVLDAQHFGVPQRRRRVFFVGHLGVPFGAAAEVLLEPDSRPRDPSEGGEEGEDVAPDIEGGPRADGPVSALLANGSGVNGPDVAHAQAGHLIVEDTEAFQCHGNNVGPMGTLRQGNGGLTGGVPFVVGDGWDGKVARTLTSPNNGPHYDLDTENWVVDDGEPIRSIHHGEDVLINDDIAQPLTVSKGTPGTLAIPFRKARRAQTSEDVETWVEEDVANTLNVFDVGNTRTTTAIVDVIPIDSAATGGRTGDANTPSPDAEGRVRLRPPGLGVAEPGDPSYTLPSQGSPPGVATALVVRRLTPMEATRLQGFPDDWVVPDADAEEAHTRQVLHGLWETVREEAREGWRSRIALALLTPQVLLAGVHVGWVPWEVAGGCAAARGQIPGEDPWPEDFVFALREHAQCGSASSRWQSTEQLIRQLGRPVSVLSHAGAWREDLQLAGVWEEAQRVGLLRYALPEGEEARHTKPLKTSDSSAYKQLGNAVAVPCARWIADRLADTHRRIHP